MRNACSASLLIAASLIAAPAAAETVYGLTPTRIVTFDSSAPGTILSSSPITGINGNVSLSGIDFRPADGQLYALGTNGNLYRLTLNGNAYQATDLGALTTAPQGSSFAFDFNPMADRTRIISDTNQNLRANQTASPPAVIVDGAITLNGSSNVDLIGAAYTNNVAGATSTTLYGLDAFTDALVRSTSANAGTYVNTNLGGGLFGPLGVSFTTADLLGFDISGTSGLGFFNLNDGFFSIDLNTGAATRIGTIGSGSLIGLSLAPAGAVPEPGTWAMMLIGFGAIGATMRRRRRSVTAKLAQMA